MPNNNNNNNKNNNNNNNFIELLKKIMYIIYRNIWSKN